MKHFLALYLLLLFFKAEAQTDNYTWSLKFGGTSLSKIINSGATYDWYGHSKGPEFLVGLGYKNFHFNTSYKYFGNEIKENLPYNNTEFYLPKGATVNMVFWNLSLSYEKEIIQRLFIEPTVGYLKNHITSNVEYLNGDEFEIRDINGVTVGANLIKYFKLQEGLFLGLYVNSTYNFVNYQQLNSDLKNNSIGYSIGAIIKGTNAKKRETVWM